MFQDTLSAQYILQQYIAASGGRTLLNSIVNSYATGRVKMMASTCETVARVTKDSNGSRDASSGGFVLWQMTPGMWYVELAVGDDSKVHAGCDGILVWRHTPWLGAHSAKGPIRPLRRALQVSFYHYIWMNMLFLSLFVLNSFMVSYSGARSMDNSLCFC